MPALPIVTLLTDFGTVDPWVAQVRAVLLSGAAPCLPTDLTHEIEPGDIEAGAFFLRAVAPRFPPGTIHLAVVDPGVGSARRLVAVRALSQVFLGPDNGLLEAAYGGDFEARSIERPDLFSGNGVATFHGRDRLAPVAVALLAGAPFDSLGPRLADPVRLASRLPKCESDGWHGHVVWIDRFGNLITDLPAALLEELPHAAIHIEGRAVTGRASHYAEIAPGTAAALRGSLDTVELASFGDSLARAWGVRRGAKACLR